MARGAQGALVLLCAWSLPLQAFSVTKAEHEASAEVVVAISAGGHVGLSTRGPGAFRVRLLPNGTGSAPPFDSPMVNPDEPDAPFERFKGKGQGISASFGAITVSSKSTLVLWKGHVGGQVLAETTVFNLDKPSLTFLENQPSWSSHVNQHPKVFGGGASPMDAESFSRGESTAMVCNRATYAPQYYHSNGFAALGVVQPSGAQTLNLSWKMHDQKISWSFSFPFELYLIPAETLEEGTLGLYELTGAPLVPPRYAFGFFASRWGWKDKAYDDLIVDKFRKDKFPLDSVIFDFEWFANDTDYGFDHKGKSWYEDFGYNPHHFPKPQENLAIMHKEQNLRVGGIRKPRLGNSELLKLAGSKGWLLPGAEPGGTYPPKPNESYAHKRNLDFSKPAVRDWYSKKLSPLIEDGFDFWWNDEAEAEYFLFHWWNVAEIQALRRVSEDRRFFSLNRAFSPGMARLGAAAWTGDIKASWEDMQNTAGMMLNWILSGMPHVGCDIGGFDGEASKGLLVRWMQMGVFMPIMRVHSASWSTPHWPWMVGQKASEHIRSALELRYTLLPYHYSLAHGLYSKKGLWIRPLAMDFPDDVSAASITSQWMDGDILVAPIMHENSTRSVYLPDGRWYKFGTPEVIQGPTSLGGVAEMDEVPAYVKPGAIITLAGKLAYADALPGGPLQVQVYTGANGEFRFVEDDGETMGYQEGRIRATVFKWDEATSTLSWTMEGTNLADSKGFENVFKEIEVIVFDGEADDTMHAETTAVGDVGSVSAAKWRQGLLRSTKKRVLRDSRARKEAFSRQGGLESHVMKTLQSHRTLFVWAGAISGIGGVAMLAAAVYFKLGHSSETGHSLLAGSSGPVVE